jgi:superfamily II DNA or RNA helicase
MQLPTGTGKSLDFGLMACYIKRFFNMKVAVVVPTESLAAYQQKRYAPWASMIGDDLADSTVIDIHYITYDDFLSGDIPVNTFLLVDEIDSLFFSDSPYIKGNRLISAIVLLRKYKVIGMTATFRGGQGTNKLLSLLKNV